MKIGRLAMPLRRFESQLPARDVESINRALEELRKYLEGLEREVQELRRKVK